MGAERGSARRARGRLLALVVAFCGAVNVGAEGARLRLECTVVRVCDARGACEPGAGAIEFRLAPLGLDADRGGRYTLEYDGGRAEAEAPSEAGPFLWTIGTERNALLASSETEWLWHRLTVEPAPQATVRFLECAVRH